MAKIPVEQIVALCQEVFPDYVVGGSMSSAFVEIPNPRIGIVTSETITLEQRGLRMRSLWVTHDGVMVVQVVSA